MENKRLNLAGTYLLQSPDLNLEIKANVPGSIYHDLLNANIIPDPFDQDNEDLVKEYMNYDYSYERDFFIDSDYFDNRTNYLVFEGLDTVTEVYLNEALILETDNMHRIYRVDVKDSLVLGNNHLKIVIKSVLKYINDKEENYPYKLYQAGDSIKGYIHLRKASYMFGWDWGPQLPDGGISRDIYLESVKGAYLDNVLITQNHRNELVSIDVLTSVVKTEHNSFNLNITVVDNQNQEIANVDTNQTNEVITIDIPDPKLWYPTGYGKQDLYKLNVKLYYEDKLLEEKTIPFGLRTVELLQEADTFGESFTFIVNGIKVFAKGANYIPEDNLLSRTNKAKTEKLLKAALLANHNMVRVWGGGIYPPDTFYDLCDELGLLVWQDLMFACSIYPMDNLKFKETLKQELIDNLKRMRNHPCIVLICGNNENETAIEHWNVPNKEISKQFYIEQYIDLVPQVVKQYYPNIPYWRSSPASKDLFIDTNSDNYGDMHYWGVWHNNEPFTNYRKYFPRFMSEFGLQSFPSIETIHTFARPKDQNIFSYIMEKHQKNKTANSKILDYMGKLFKYPKDFESLLYVSQAIQAEGIRYGVEHWRRNFGRCMGILYWQLNDCWPVASWSSIDYYQRWKILHYASKKFFAPVLVSIEETKTNAKIYITNDHLESVTGELRYQFRDFNNQVYLDETIEVEINPQSANLIKELNLESFKKQFKEVFLYVEFMSEGQLLSENTCFFAPDKHLLLDIPTYSCELSTLEDISCLTLKTDTLAKFVEIKVKEEDVIFTDNYFHLIPGKEKTICFKSNQTIDKNKLEIRSLVDSF